MVKLKVESSTKICRKCGFEKNITDFYENHGYTCKQCEIDSTKKHYEEKKILYGTDFIKSENERKKISRRTKPPEYYQYKEYLKINGLRVCSRCHKEKKLEEFSGIKRKEYKCKQCKSEENCSIEYLEEQKFKKYLVENNLRKCSRCGEIKSKTEFHSAGKKGLDYYCKNCKNETIRERYNNNLDKERERSRNYYANHTEQHKLAVYKNNNEHPEKTRLYRKQYHIDNIEKRKEQIKNWRIANRSRHNELVRLWRKNNHDHFLEISRKYKKEHKQHYYELNKKYRENDPEKFRIRSHLRRDLGFKPLNSWFEGSEFHHLIILPDGSINNNIGIYIPRDLHRSIKHSRKTMQGFDEINKLAWEFFYNQQKTLSSFK